VTFYRNNIAKESQHSEVSLIKMLKVKLAYLKMVGYQNAKNVNFYNLQITTITPVETIKWLVKYVFKLGRVMKSLSVVFVCYLYIYYF